MTRRAAACAALVAGLASPAAAGAQGEGVGQTAPAYPNNSVKISVGQPIVAGVPATVTLSGRADWNEPTDATTTDYSLYMYAADASVNAQCAVSYSEQLSKSINLPGLNASVSITGFVVDGIGVGPAPPASGRDYAVTSTPFAIKPGISKVLLCAYQRFVIDDVAVYALPVDVAQPSCRPASASVRRGASLGLRCNVSGPARVVFRRAGGGGKTVSAQLSTTDGSGSAPTGGLRAGRYRVSVSSNGVSLGSFGVRLR